MPLSVREKGDKLIMLQADQMNEAESPPLSCIQFVFHGVSGALFIISFIDQSFVFNSGHLVGAEQIMHHIYAKKGGWRSLL